KDFRPGATDRFVTRTRLASWQNDVRTDYGTWLIGIEQQRQDVDTTSPLLIDSRTTDSGFIGWAGTFGASSFQVNARHDDIEHFGGQKTWSVGYGYQLTDALR